MRHRGVVLGLDVEKELLVSTRKILRSGRCVTYVRNVMTVSGASDAGIPTWYVLFL